MDVIKGVVLLFVVLGGFSLFSMKAPKGMKAMGALAGAATASFLVEAFQLYVGGDLFGIPFLGEVGKAAGSMGGVASAILVPIALGVNPTYAVLVGISSRIWNITWFLSWIYFIFCYSKSRAKSSSRIRFNFCNLFYFAISKINSISI